MLVLKVFLKRTLQREILIIYVFECKRFPCPMHIYFQLPVNLGKNLRERTLKVRCSAVFVLAMKVYGGTVV